jgi:polycystin 1L2
MADWFLKFIIVHDLQSRQKSYFICDKWLSLNKDDGMIERTLGVCGEKQKTEFKYLLSKQAKQSMTDNHLWFSIFTRTLNNSFTRLDRLTCCYVLLLMSMLMNILYYDIDKSKVEQGALKIGPFILTIQQVIYNG